MGSCSSELEPWPAESEKDALNLSKLDSGFAKDLSGAVWNPHTGTLWVCRNGPNGKSRLWVLEEDGADGMRVRTDGEVRGEWSELGDCEGVTFASFEEEVVYLIVEGEEAIHELDVSIYGEWSLNRVYDTSPYLPRDGSSGAEGITFVPDEHLRRAGFVDASGAPRASTLGMGGLFLVGHQEGGGIYAFDLNRETGDVDFVGEYHVGAADEDLVDELSNVVALEFDRSSGQLFAWHGAKKKNRLSVSQLGSTAVQGSSTRTLRTSGIYEGPKKRTIEGLAVFASKEGDAEERGLFLTVDDSKAHALHRYMHLRLPLPATSPPP